MSDERADAIPEAASEAFREVLFRWHPALRDILDDTALDEALAAAAPHMTGNGEAERLREERDHALDDIELLRAVNARLVNAVDQARINAACAGEMADQAEDALRAAQPDAERAPQEEPMMRPHHARQVADEHDRRDEAGQPYRRAQPDAEAERLREALAAIAQAHDNCCSPELRHKARAALRLGPCDPDQGCPFCSDRPNRYTHPDAERAPQPEPCQDELEAVARALLPIIRPKCDPVFADEAWPFALTLARAALDAARRPPSEQSADGG